ncbi:MAG: hypothetical protein IT410_01595 [Candidatus Doudnabacteria bacterium]|nr:hypothetical protein [Candidatus Doudnabacteria bacterium]
MNTNHDDGAPRLDPELENSKIQRCIRSIDAMLDDNGEEVGAYALLVSLSYPSVREAVVKHYYDRYTVEFDEDSGMITVFLPKGGIEKPIAKAMAAGA